MQNMAWLQRCKYDELLKRYQQYGVEVQPSYLRYEQTIQNGVNHYPFPFEPSPNDSQTEKKLNKNDSFYVTSITFGFIVTGTIAGTSPAPDITISEANAPLRTFAKGDYANLEALYNGFIRITTGSKINLQKIGGKKR